MTTQETVETKKRGRKPKAESVSTEETTAKKSHKETLADTLTRVELLRDRRTDKEAKALLTGLTMGLKFALRKGTLVERSGRFYLTGTDEL